MDYDSDLAHKTFRERQDYDRQARGQIIYAAVSIESEVEQIIAQYFCEERKHPLFISLIFIGGQITFSQKLIILKKLLKDSYPDLLGSVPGMFAQLDKIRELRNKLAHSKMQLPFPVDKSLFEKPVTKAFPLGTPLQYYKDGKELTEFISQEQVNEALEKAVAFRDLLYYMHEEIKNRMKNRRNDNFKVVLRVFKEGYPGLLKN